MFMYKGLDEVMDVHIPIVCSDIARDANWSSPGGSNALIL